MNNHVDQSVHICQRNADGVKRARASRCGITVLAQAHYGIVILILIEWYRRHQLLQNSNMQAMKHWSSNHFHQI